MSDNGTRTGWGWPGAARKAHYFDGSTVSLCGKWMFSGVVEASALGEKPGSHDCVSCWRKASTAVLSGCTQTAREAQ